MLANLFWAALPLDAVIFNAGQLAITTYISAIVYQWAGGTPGVPLTLPGDFTPLILTMITYAFVNVSLVIIGIALDNRKPILAIWLASIKWAIPNYTCLGPLGILAAEIYYSSLSMYGILLLWIPLLFARYSFQQYWEIRRAHVKTIEALALALDARDPYTSGHSERVAVYSGTMATRLKMQDVEVEQIRFAGILHDIGKYSAEFQHRLEGVKIQVDHSTAGAQTAVSLYGKSLGTMRGYVIADRRAP
jgi:putative nucleotidyltransferase with HDIG domain